MKNRIRNFLSKTCLTKRYRLKLKEKRLEKELGEALGRAKATGNQEDIAWANCEYNSELYMNYEEQQVLFTESLINKADEFRVHIPVKPKWTHENGFEQSEDWVTSGTELYLTTKGSSKVEEEIEKKKKWRRERWAFVVQCTSAAITVIGTMSGWIAFYLK
jgi:hypothetical protein